MVDIDESLITQARAWFKDLLRLDTTNPPGDERKVIDYVSGILTSHGIQPTVIAKSSQRPNLIATLPGDDQDSGLLLSSHADVVPVEDAARWTHPPFAATESDGMIWGRGAVDFKYKIAFDMAVLVWLKAKKRRAPLKIVVVADEEHNCAFGSKFLCEAHLDLIRSAYVLNEVGGINFEVAGKEYFLIQGGEKSAARLILKVRGVGGHASIASAQSTVATLLSASQHLIQALPTYDPPATSKAFFKTLANSAEPSVSPLFLGMLDAGNFEQALNQLPDPALRAQLRAMLCNVVSPTVLKAGVKHTVVPENAEAEFDCRLMPHLKIDEVFQQLKYILENQFVQSECEVELTLAGGHQGYEMDMNDPLFTHLAKTTGHRWGSGPDWVLPFLLPASSDSSNYFRAGIRPLGFAPLRFPSGFPGLSLAHAVDERVPVSAFEDGLRLYSSAISSWLIK